MWARLTILKDSVSSWQRQTERQAVNTTTSTLIWLRRLKAAGWFSTEPVLRRATNGAFVRSDLHPR
jgi:hypothetical protein